MNGYVKMKRLRRMRVTKIISAVTALSMTVTGLAVATSANSASPNAISNALGDLSDYGIVAESMTTNSHFESNYAVKDLTLNNNYDVSRFVSGKSRTITFTITSDESCDEGPVTHLLGVYSNGERINVEYQGQTTSGLIAVDFSKPGTKTFDVTIPEEYKYETITVHKMALNEHEDEYGDVYTALEFEDEGVQFFPHAIDAQDALIKNSRSIVSDSMNVSGEMFGTDKTIYVGSEIYGTLKFENDGRISGLKPRVEWVTDPETGKAVPQPVYDEEGNQIYDTTIIANNTNKFYEMPNASEEVDRLVSYIKTASDNLAAINSGSVEDKVLYEKINGSIYSGSEEAKKILEDYTFIKNNPSYSLLVNVYLDEGENSYVFNSGDIGDWDADSSSRIVFNFIGGQGADKTHITLGDGFRGVVVAPNARVSNSSTICGAVYAPEYVVSNGELHMATYRAFNDSYEAYYYDTVIITTTEETTTEEETTEETTEETSEETTPEETTPEETTPEETTPEETTPEETTPEETTPEETTPEETTPEVTTPEETVPETTPEETTPPETPEDTTTPEPSFSVPETTPEETTPEETTPPETTPEETTPEETTPPETTPEETTPETTPEETTPPETTPEETVPETTPEETTPPETTPEETVPETTSEETTPGFEVPETTTTENAETTEATTLPPEETTTPHETSTTTTVLETFPVEETPRTVLELIEEEVPRNELILIDEQVPLGDMPMNTGVESNIGVFAVIGGAALMVGAGAQFYSVILRKKH